jgi:hypothetical protein
MTVRDSTAAAVRLVLLAAGWQGWRQCHLRPLQCAVWCAGHNPMQCLPPGVCTHPQRRHMQAALISAEGADMPSTHTALCVYSACLG